MACRDRSGEKFQCLQKETTLLALLLHALELQSHSLSGSRTSLTLNLCAVLAVL